MRRLPCAIAAAPVVIVCSLVAHATASQQTGEHATRVARAAFERSVAARLDDRWSRCMKAIGNRQFCGCLNAGLALEVDFQRYIAITTTADRRIGRERLDLEDTPIVLRTLSTRDRCVGQVFGEQTK